jgi:gas vesicle protein
MESVSTVEFKSPVKKLSEFFRRSRDNWKEKYLRKRDENILLANKVRAVEKSRQHWSEVAQAAKQEVKQAKAELRQLREELKKISD